MKNQINIRASELTTKLLGQLQAVTGMSQTELVSNAVSRMYADLVTTQSLAGAIYQKSYTGIDDKNFRNQKTSEIQDWLKSGSGWVITSIQSLVEEWLEYDSQEPEKDDLA